MVLAHQNRSSPQLAATYKVSRVLTWGPLFQNTQSATSKSAYIKFYDLVISFRFSSMFELNEYL